MRRMHRRSKNIYKLAIIIILLIAVTATSFFIQRKYNARNEETADHTKRITSEQQSDLGPVEYTGGKPLATLFFASDYQAEEGFDKPSVSLEKILASAEADGRMIDRAIMCGDYTNDRKLHDYQLSPDDSIVEIRKVVETECPDADEEVLFVQGNHDRMTSQITPTGLYETESYIIYILNTEDDFPWKQGKTAGCLAKVRKSSAEMKACFDELIRNGETRPVFIAGHVPLHFTARTSSRHTTGDNLYSSLIFDVVNEAAESLDIIYLFGHDHSKGWDCYLGGSSVYKAKGDDILIPRFSEEKVNTDEYSSERLNFTYMNAGYVGYYMNCGPEEHDSGEEGEYSAADETLTGTVFEIYADRIIVTRYDADGRHVLGHEGEADPYRDGIDAGLIDNDSYSDKTESPQTILLRDRFL